MSVVGAIMACRCCRAVKETHWEEAPVKPQSGGNSRRGSFT